MIYCARKILKAKYNKHKETNFCSLKNYSVDIYKQALERELCIRIIKMLINVINYTKDLS